jgi:hypothetical protein
MSTYYRPTAKIPLNDIKKLKEFDVIFDDNNKLFFDGKNYLHFATDKDNNVIDVFRYGGNDESFILKALVNNFDVEMVSEYHEGYQYLADRDTAVQTIKFEGGE